jgi:hypothetical protein
VTGFVKIITKRDVVARANKIPDDSKRRTKAGKRPDALVSEVEQSAWGSCRAYGEAKVAEKERAIYDLAVDLIRLAVFAKDSIDESKMRNVLTFQVIGNV